MGGVCKDSSLGLADYPSAPRRCGRRAVSATLPAMRSPASPSAVMAKASSPRPDTVANHVSGAANSVDERTVKALVDLRSQPRDMHVNNVGLRVEVIVPNMLEQHGAG